MGREHTTCVRVFADVKKKYAAHAITADVGIVGAALKRDALWTNPVDSARAVALRRAFDAPPAR